MATSKPFQSQKVGRTLQELESAFADWEALTDAPIASPAAAPASETRKDSELRKKTKMLLDQLREQLKDLED